MTCKMSNGYIAFKLPHDFCNPCKHQNECKIFGKKHVEVLDDQDRALHNSYLEWSRTEEYEENYKRRKAIVEPVFGNIKNKGIRIFCRGKKAVNRWWNIATTAHNLEKIVKHMRLIPQM
jgi:transposase